VVNKAFGFFLCALVAIGCSSCAHRRVLSYEVDPNFYRYTVKKDLEGERFLISIHSLSRYRLCVGTDSSANPSGFVSYQFPGALLVSGLALAVPLNEESGLGFGQSAYVIPPFGKHEFFVRFDSFGTSQLDSQLAEAELRYFPEVRWCGYYSGLYPARSLP
jgi:hypothetical protein